MTSNTPVSGSTLLAALRPAAVDFAELKREFAPLLQLVRLLIGVVPNCDPYLAIWPIGFRSYNLLVPNLLNLPFSVWGLGPPATPLGLGMIAASKTAQCAYCTAHACSFTLRRSGTPDHLNGDTPGERAAVAAGEALAHIPCRFRFEMRDELLNHYSLDEAEGIALGISLMGFLNKFMDAVGVDLEESTVDEVSSLLVPTGWTPREIQAGDRPEDPLLKPMSGGQDTLGTKLALLRYVPGAIRLESGWTQGVPDSWPEVGSWLREHTGHPFPLLARLRSKRAIRAIATVLRDNLTPAEGGLDLRVKVLAGLVYALTVQNKALARETRGMAARMGHGRRKALLDGVARFAAEPFDPGESTLDATLAHLKALPGLNAQTALVLLLAKAISPSPAFVPEPLVARVARDLAPEIQIELVVWISIQQMLHRLGHYLGSNITTSAW